MRVDIKINQKEQQPVQIWSSIIKGMVTTIEKYANKRQTKEKKGGSGKKIK